jgi:hypothetical protein
MLDRYPTLEEALREAWGDVMLGKPGAEHNYRVYHDAVTRPGNRSSMVAARELLLARGRGVPEAPVKWDRSGRRV